MAYETSSMTQEEKEDLLQDLATQLEDELRELRSRFEKLSESVGDLSSFYSDIRNHTDQIKDEVRSIRHMKGYLTEDERNNELGYDEQDGGE